MFHSEGGKINTTKNLCRKFMEDLKKGTTEPKIPQIRAYFCEHFFEHYMRKYAFFSQ